MNDRIDKMIDHARRCLTDHDRRINLNAALAQQQAQWLSTQPAPHGRAA